jgi:hypothetical protein
MVRTSLSARRAQATLAQALTGQPVVEQAEHRDDEGRNIHGETLVRCGDGVTSSVRGSFQLTQEPAHRVTKPFTSKLTLW